MSDEPAALDLDQPAARGQRLDRISDGPDAVARPARDRVRPDAGSHRVEVDRERHHDAHEPHRWRRVGAHEQVAPLAVEVDLSRGHDAPPMSIGLVRLTLLVMALTDL
jgi:hypothetical protein